MSSDAWGDPTWYDNELELGPIGGIVGVGDPSPSATTLSIETKTKLKQVFDFINFDGSGSVSQHELKLALQEIGMNHDDAFVEKIFKRADRNGRGFLTYTDFEDACTRRRDSFGAFAFSNIAQHEMMAMGIDLPEEFQNLEATFKAPKKNPAPAPPTPPPISKSKSSSNSSLSSKVQQRKDKAASTTEKKQKKDAATIPSKKKKIEKIKVKVPVNATPGKTAEFTLPDGRTMSFLVPKSAHPGGVITVQVDHTKIEADSKKKKYPKRKPASSVSKADADLAFKSFQRIDTTGCGKHYPSSHPLSICIYQPVLLSHIYFCIVISYLFLLSKTYTKQDLSISTK